MEKISHIVRGSSRVASTDMTATSAVRPGTPSFGRPVGESPASADHFGTTASRAVAIHNDMLEHKRAASQDQTATHMADQFFMTRVRRPEEEPEQPSAPAKVKAEASEPAELEARSTDDLVLNDTRNGEMSAPVGFKPRGTYVDVQA